MLPDIMGATVKVLIVEERNLLREKIAGILSREEYICMVIQVASYSRLRTALRNAAPDIFLADFFEFNKFCKNEGILVGSLCPDASILLYTDEYMRLSRIEGGQPIVKRVFDVRRIQEEVKNFMRDERQANTEKTIKRRNRIMSDKKTVGERVDKVVDKVSKKVDDGKDNVAKAKKDISDAARDIKKSVKKAVEDTGDAVADLIHTK